MDKADGHIVSEIFAAKPNVNGKTPRGYAEKLLKDGKETFPRINRISLTT
jgi:hypothetical protein